MVVKSPFCEMYNSGRDDGLCGVCDELNIRMVGPDELAVVPDRPFELVPELMR